MEGRSESAASKGSRGAKSSAAATSKESKLQPPGRLVGVTAAGPVYLGQRQFAIVPVASIFATLQELAYRVDNASAPVTSSIAGRVSGDEAYTAWLEMSASCAAQLTSVTLGGRLKFLRFLLAYVARVGRVDGLEPLLTTAVNAAWPAMSSQTMSSTLSLTAAKLRKSAFAAKHPIPVLDVNRRVAGIFGPGELVKVDLEEWRAQRDLGADGYNGLPEGLGGKVQDALKSPLERALDEIFGGTGDGSLEDAAVGLMPGGDTKGVPGGLPSLGDVPGKKDSSKPSSGGSLEDIAAGLLPNSGSPGVPGGLPSIGDLPGQKGSGQGLGIPGMGLGHSGHGPSASDLLNSIPGSEYAGISGFLKKSGPRGFMTGIFEGATPGGPFAPPGQLGINGSGGEMDPDQKVVVGLSVAVGGAFLLGGAVGAVMFGAPVAAVGALVVVGGVALGYGIASVAKGLDETPKPPKSSPHEGDLYPDPIGGGGGNPTQLPDYDGHGGGNPTTMPDYDGHGGGTPNTIFGRPNGGASIWDENFGGSGPKVRPQSFTAVSLVGPGLLADVVQVGPSAIRY